MECFRGKKNETHQEPSYEQSKHLNTEAEAKQKDKTSRKGKRVMICSRDSEDNHQWLRDLLHTERFQRKVKLCRPVYISSNTAEFRQEVRRYDVAILYHSKTRGRINITNVTDSLYDEELRFLHDRLGAKKVVVVIDDLESSDEEEKRRIMEAQEDLGRFAKEVLLFTDRDKRGIKNGRSEDLKVDQKLETLKMTIKNA